MKKYLIGFVLGLTIGNFLLLYGFHLYTDYRLARLDKQANLISAFNEPHQILDMDHDQNPMRRLQNKPINPVSPLPPQPPQVYP